MDPEKPLVLTGGDPAGIAPEIIEKALRAVPINRSLIYLSTAGPSHNAQVRRILAQTGPVRILEQRDHQKEQKSNTPKNNSVEPSHQIIDLQTDETYRNMKSPEVISGSPSLSSGYLSHLALEYGADLVERDGGSLVTAPLSKEWVHKSRDPGFTGHTGYLARRENRSVHMLMHGQEFGVIPLTVHIPLSRVSTELRKELYDPSLVDHLRDLSSRSFYRKKPWALLSLNPHGGEGGVTGKEEIEFMYDAWKRLQKAGLPIAELLPADGAFQAHVRKRYSLFLASYHDQGLIPFKALQGETGVNITLGLSYFRVSPDHGTAFEIAGKGVASSLSMEAAIRVASNPKSMDPDRTEQGS